MVETIRTKILAVLAEANEPLDIQAIAEGTGAQAKSVSEALSRLNKEGKVANPEKGLWQIKAEGRLEVDKQIAQEAGSKELEQEPGKPHRETAGTIPSQSDLFRSIGEKLGVGSKRGDIRLDAVTYYVQRTANLDNLTSVWNAMTEMGVAADVRKRWVKIYAMNLPGKEIPEELREKLEGGEPERIKTEAEGVSAKPKQFSVVGGEIIGDLEGDYSFKEALQYVAQQKGASPNEAGSMALELSKMGPDMLTSLLSAVTPLLNKEPPRSDMDIILKLTEAGLLRKPGEGEGSETIRALEMQVKELKDSLQTQALDSVKSVVVSLGNQVSDLRKEIQSQSRLEGRYAILDKTITTLDSQLTGFRSDARPLLDSFARGGGRAEPTMRTPEEKARIAKGLKVAVAQERRAHELEDELLFGKPPPEESAEVTAEPAPEPAEPAPAPEPPPITYIE